LETGSGDCKAEATGNLTNCQQNILSIDLCKQFKKIEVSPNHDFVVISNDKMHMVIMLWKTELHGMMTFGAAPCIESIAPLLDTRVHGKNVSFANKIVMIKFTEISILSC
jgi:hypothetical protein